MGKINVHLVILLLAILLYCPKYISAQVELVSNQDIMTIKDNTDIWNLEIQNNGGEMRVYLESAVIDEQGEIVYEMVSEPFYLQGGRNIFRGNEIQKGREVGNFSNLAGNYNVCTAVKSETSENALNMRCRNVAFGVKKNMPISLPKPNIALPKPNIALPKFSLAKPKKIIQSTGTIRVAGQMIEDSVTYPLAARNYLQISASPSLSIFSIPIKGSFTGVLSDSGWVNNWQFFQLQFNAQSLQQSLKAQIMDSLKSSVSGDALRERLEQMKVEELQKLQASVGNLIPDSLLNKWQNVESQYKNLETILNQDVFSQNLAQWDSVMNQYGLLDSLHYEQFMDSIKNVSPEMYQNIERLQSIQRQYQALNQQYQQAKKMYESIAALKKKLPANYLEKLQALKSGNPEALLKDAESLKNAGFLSKAQKLMLNVNKFGIGIVSPNMSRLFTDGVLLKGGEIAVSPHKWYVHIAGGQVRLPMANISQYVYPYRQYVGALRLGWGKVEGNHIHLMALYGQESQNPKEKVDSSAIFRTNEVIGINLGLKLWKDRLKVMGEGAFSSLDSRGNGLVSRNDVWGTPIQYGRVYGNSWNTQLDWASGKKNSLLKARFGQTSIAYFSMAAPMLQRNRFMYDFNFTQSFFKGKMSFNVFAKQLGTVLSISQYRSGMITNYGMMFTYRDAKLPTITMSLSPLYRGSPSPTDSTNTTQGWTAFGQLYYSFKIGKGQNMTTLTYTRQVLSDKDSLGFNINLLSLQNMLTLSQKMSIALNGNYTQIGMQSGKNLTYLLADLAIITQFNNNIRPSLGVTADKRPEFGLRGGAYCGWNIPFAKSFVTEGRVTYFYYPTYQNQATHQGMMGRVSLSYTW